MERLNLRTAKTSDYSSESEKTELIIKFFCVSEGATEESYFEGVRNNRVVLKIKNGGNKYGQENRNYIRTNK